ncbi:MAG: P1 family peptidase [Polyangia bacterium]
MTATARRRGAGWLGLVAALGGALAADASAKPRARDLGLPLEGQPGRYNAITDVPEVEVGHTTLIAGSGALVLGRGPVRTGVTAILPRGKSRTRSIGAACTLNGNGELTGTHWVNESGLLESPILLTNTHSVGVVHDAVIAWGNRRFPPQPGGMLSEAFSLPVVGETYDGFLNDINGHHVKPEHVFAALDGARSGPVAEGSVGGGTGMVCGEWKCGIGTSSRRVSVRGSDDAPAREFTVGALVQANYGRRPELRILGVPVGREIPDLLPLQPGPRKDGSILVVLGTDAPLLPHQLARLCRRASLGLARTGSVSRQTSGDLFIAFGPAEPPVDKDGLQRFPTLPNDALDPLLASAVQATEEAILNALVAGETMVGINGNTVYGLPHDRLKAVLRKYGIGAPAAPAPAPAPAH